MKPHMPEGHREARDPREGPRDPRDERRVDDPADPRDKRVIPADARDARGPGDPRDARSMFDREDGERPHTITSRLLVARHQRPFTVAFSLILTVPGALAIVYGDSVSQALSNISAGILSRCMGAALLLGSVITLEGISRGKHLTECTGLALMAAGCAVYGLGVILGLGLAGMVAGPGFIAISVGAVLRIIGLTYAARAVDESG